MRKKLYRWFTWPILGKLPTLLFVKRSALHSQHVAMVDKEEFEYLMFRLHWQWLRGFLLGVVCVVVIGVVSFFMGVRTAWVAEDNYFQEACTKVVNMACQKPNPPLPPLSPFKVHCERQWVGASPL